MTAKRPLVIFGAGKVAQVVFRHMLLGDDYEVVGFTCDREHLPERASFAGLPAIAFDDVTAHFPPDRHALIVAVGYHELNGLRARKYAEARAKGYELASCVSTRAAYGDWLATGDNCIVLDNAVVEPYASIGSNVVVWSGVLLGHHAVLGDHCWIAGNTVIGGSARIGARSFVGLGAMIGNDVVLGEGCFVGAGARVTKCAPAKSVFIERGTELFRLDSERFLRISKLR